MVGQAGKAGRRVDRQAGKHSKSLPLLPLQPPLQPRTVRWQNNEHLVASPSTPPTLGPLPTHPATAMFGSSLSTSGGLYSRLPISSASCTQSAAGEEVVWGWQGSGDGNWGRERGMGVRGRLGWALPAPKNGHEGGDEGPEGVGEWRNGGPRGPLHQPGVPAGGLAYTRGGRLAACAAAARGGGVKADAGPCKEEYCSHG